VDRGTEWQDAAGTLGEAPEAVGPKCRVCHYEVVEIKGAVCEYCKVKYKLK
jgi:hypothetical protein